MHKIYKSLLLIIFTVVSQSSLIQAQTNSISYDDNNPKYQSTNAIIDNNDLSHGKKNINIPMYVIKTGGIEYPISLAYSTGGIKVDQRASDVGLGWNLSSAIITRTINQSCDFDNTGSMDLEPDYNSYSQIDKTANYNYHMSYSEHNDKGQIFGYYNSFGQIGYFLQKQINFIVNQSNIMVDNIPDVYNFYSNGSYSSTFFFNDINSPIEINPKDTKISAVSSKIRIDTKRGYWNTNHNWVPRHNFPTQDFFTIYITTNKGIKYTFSDCDYSFNEKKSLSYNDVPPAKIAVWHITKIEDLNTGKSINFVYDTVTLTNTNGAAYPNDIFEFGTQKSYNTIWQPLSGDDKTCKYYQPYNPNASDRIELSETRNYDVQKKRLKKIIFDEGEINFNYNNNGIPNAPNIIRSDIFNADCITQVYIKNEKAVIIKQFDLEYDYFQSNYNVGEFNPDGIFNSYRYKRLKLTSLKETGSPKYKFYYDETVNLPAINSFSIDFAGYYNNSPDVPTISQIKSLAPSPTVFFYKGKFQESFSPFPIANMNPDDTEVIPGYFNRQSNDFAKTWSLNKIVYPLGGSAEYTYESNNFEINGQNINGGGIRIAKEVLKNDKGLIKILNYSYLKEDGTSSGSLNSFPFFCFPTVPMSEILLDYPLDEKTQPSMIDFDRGVHIYKDYLKIYDKSFLNSDLTNNSYVNYSNVKISETGNGREEFTYTSNNISGFKDFIFRTPATNYPNLFEYTLLADQGGDIDFCMVDNLIGHSGLNTHIFTDNTYKRGKLINNKIFDESNKIIRETTIDYFDFNLNSYNFTQTFTQPIKRWTDGEINFRFALFVAKKNINISNYLPIKKTITNYEALGGMISTVSNYTYNTSKTLLASEETKNSDDKNEITKFYYPGDSEMALEPFVNQLKSKNTISIPLKIEIYKGSEKIFEKKLVYASDISTSNLLLPKYISTKKGINSNSTLEKIISYDKYDEQGNVLQYTTQNNPSISIIWGYQKSLPIAYFENTTYSSLNRNLVTAAQTASNIGTEASLLIALNNLRASLSNTMITTYTYFPLVGVSTITDTKGDKIIYTYNSSGRLQDVKDKNGNILSENEYHYKN